MKKTLASIVLLSTLTGFAHAASCDREPRVVPFNDKPMDVALAPDEQVEVTFPEPLVGVLPETPEGLVWNRTPFKEKLMFSAADANYSGNFMAHGESGKSYILKLSAKDSCGDIAVRIDKAQIVNMANMSTDSQGRKSSLIEYMIKGKTPPGYYQSVAKGAKADRLISKIGTVNWYLHETFEGPRYIGTVVQLENRGRTPYRVAIEKINYQSPSIRRVFGKVREVAMLPTDRRLDPHPEYVSGVVAGQHEGLVFIVSEKGAYGSVR